MAVLGVVVLLAGCTSPSGAQAGPPSTATTADGGMSQGQLTAAQPTFSEPLHLAAGHGRLAVTLAMTSNLPDNRLVLNVTGPGGRSAQAEVTPELDVLPSNAPTVAFDAPAGGDWTVRIQLASGAAAGYQMDWCADDAAHPGPSQLKSCHHYGSP